MECPGHVMAGLTCQGASIIAIKLHERPCLLLQQQQQHVLQYKVSYAVSSLAMPWQKGHAMMSHDISMFAVEQQNRGYKLYSMHQLKLLQHHCKK